MIIHIAGPSKIFDEYIYKVLFTVIGIIYWVYGLLPIANIAFLIIIFFSLFPLAQKLLRVRRADFRVIIALLTLFLGVFTIFMNPDMWATTASLLYMLIKMTVLAWCSRNKSYAELEKEIRNIFKLIFFLGTIILAVSFVTYLLGISIPYYAGRRTEEYATLYYVGISPLGRLSGIFGNGNEFRNLCVIYFGCTLYLFDSSKYTFLRALLLSFDIVILYLTGSRGGVVGLLLVLMVYFGVRYKDLILRGRRDLRTFLVVLFAVIFIALLLVGPVDIFGMLNREQSAMDMSTQTRVSLWTGALKATFGSFKNFMIGVGSGDGLVECMREFVVGSLPSRLYTNVHQAYIQEALTFGFPAALMMVIYLWKMLKPGLKCIVFHNNNDKLIRVLTGVVLALLITSLVDSDLLHKAINGTFVWIAAGYLYSISSRSLKNSD